GATQGFDNEFDGYKLKGIFEAPQLYSFAQDIILSINVLPEITKDLTIPLGFEAGETNEYILTASEMNSFEPIITFNLEDLQQDELINLRQTPTYTFIAKSDDEPGRFILHISNPSYSIEEKEQKDIIIYSYENNIYINVPDNVKGEIIVYNVLGQDILHKTIEKGIINKINIIYPTGYYMVKVITDKEVVLKKVFIE
ncbi:MAG: T9SS type A sorting domain-containing protein, partial [Bacteroidales bacterium]|nr:T9SS type A sorting domain-containing protein [Bacteroidales bacterium]